MTEDAAVRGYLPGAPDTYLCELVHLARRRVVLRCVVEREVHVRHELRHVAVVVLLQPDAHGPEVHGRLDDVEVIRQAELHRVHGAAKYALRVVFAQNLLQNRHADLLHTRSRHLHALVHVLHVIAHVFCKERV